VSDEKRLRMRPLGVASKKAAGSAITAVSSDWCRARAATRPPLAKLNARTCSGTQALEHRELRVRLHGTQTMQAFLPSPG
jgi:hypothetical protein